MTIKLPEDLERYVNDQVRAGLFPSEGDVILDALERHRQIRQVDNPPPSDDPVLGSMREDADLLDEVVEHAMKNRRDQPWRLPADE